MEEIWKIIQGYPNYQISNLGRVKSLKCYANNNERILKPAPNSKGYLQVCLYGNGKGKPHLVHRLVAEAFIPNPQNLPQINHKSEIKTDNRVSNLEYCDAKYNSNYGARNQNIGESNTNHPKISKQVLCVETGIIYSSTHQVERELGFSQSHISDACTGKRKTAYGHTWKYV